MNHKTNVIRETAYHIWEREGRPTGRDLEHWLEAEAIVGTGMLGPKDAAPAQRRTSTKAPAKKALKLAGSGAKPDSDAKAKVTKKTTKKSTAKKSATKKSTTKKSTAKKSTTRGRKKSEDR